MKIVFKVLGWILWVLLLLIYFFGFDLQWGLNRAAFTWGLPMLIVIIGIPFFIRRNRKKLRRFSFAITLIAIGYFWILTYFFAPVLLPVTQTVSEDNVENTILIQFLANPSHPNSKRYAVINPEASLESVSTMGNEYKDSLKAAIIGEFSTEDFDFGSLVDRLFELNENPVELTINSSPKDGYYIDYTHKFERYFQRGGGGWSRWRIFNPRAKGSHQVSIPAYDPDTGYVLMYYGFQGDWLFGGGYIIAFEYKDGKLTELDSMQLWVS